MNIDQQLVLDTNSERYCSDRLFGVYRDSKFYRLQFGAVRYGSIRVQWFWITQLSLEQLFFKLVRFRNWNPVHRTKETVRFSSWEPLKQFDSVRVNCSTSSVLLPNQTMNSPGEQGPRTRIFFREPQNHWNSWDVFDDVEWNFWKDTRYRTLRNNIGS